MANIWGKRLSPDVSSTGTRPERRTNAGWGQLSQDLRRGLHRWLTAASLSGYRRHRTSRPTLPHIGYWGTPYVHALLFAVCPGYGIHPPLITSGFRTERTPDTANHELAL